MFELSLNVVCEGYKKKTFIFHKFKMGVWRKEGKL